MNAQNQPLVNWELVMRKWKWMWPVGVFFAGGCGGAEADGSPQPGSDADFARVINVEVAEVRARPFSEQIRLTGVAQANRDVTISAEESGVIRELWVEKGSSVKVGDPLFKIDDAVLRAEVDRVRALAEIARETWERRKRIWEEDKFGTEIEYLQAKFDAAQAAATLASLERRWERTTIRAPFDGILEDRMVELGALVSPGQSVARMVDLSTIKVAAGVPERYAPDVRPGGPATVLFDVLPGEDFPARIDYVGSTVSRESRTFTIEIDMPNPRAQVKPEMVANVVVERSSLPEALVVPRDALVRVEDGYVVFVAEASPGGGRQVARARPVTLGPSQRNEVVLESGIEVGDRLIVVGHRSVADGDRINIVNP